MEAAQKIAVILGLLIIVTRGPWLIWPDKGRRLATAILGSGINLFRFMGILLIAAGAAILYFTVRDLQLVEKVVIARKSLGKF